MNDITIIGRLTRDPEYTPASANKSQYVKFTVAVDNRFGDGTSFFDVISFGRNADNIDKFLSKGRLVAVNGRMEQGEPYTDRNGNKRRSWTLKAEEVQFLDRATETQQEPKSEPSARANTEADNWEKADADMPF